MSGIREGERSISGRVGPSEVQRQETSWHSSVVLARALYMAGLQLDKSGSAGGVTSLKQGHQPAAQEDKDKKG